MKLIITGATGLVASEVVRQALLLPSITSVVAVARKPVSAPESTPAAESSKLTSVVVQDYGTYPEDVKKELAGADACIWTVAITPSKAKALPRETVLKVCQEWTLAGFKAILEANPSPAKPLQFLYRYMSGAAANDPNRPDYGHTKQWMPKSMEEYSKMRGETWSQVLAIAAENKSRVDTCVAKPGFITGSGGIMRGLFGTALYLTGAVDTIDVKEVAAAMLHQVVQGFEGTNGVLSNGDMAKTGREILAK